MKKKAVFNWSGGKDSAHALWKVMQSGEYEVIALLTTINRDTRRSTMHGIPLSLLKRQAECIGLPLHVVDLTPKGNMEDYTSAMERAVEYFSAQGVSCFVFGDIFLHEVRRYREEQLLPYGMEVVEPLWGKTSEEVMEEFLSSGLKTVVVTTMADGLGEAAIGKQVDCEFVSELPVGMDPNGENGEYHTFCYDGPLFCCPVGFRLGKAFSQSYDVRMEDGTVKTYTYWFGHLEEE